MDNLPLVTVNILSYNRKEELKNTLQKVYEQDYKNIEIIVVDNASSDGSPEMVTCCFPEVEVIRLAENIGIAGWNYGFEKAKGDYILVLDDDSYPLNYVILNGVKLFQNHKIGIVAFEIAEGMFPNNRNQIPKSNFIGCGALLSRKLLFKIGGYQPLLFLYMHEIEFTLRTVDLGFEMITSNAIVVHRLNKINRDIQNGEVDRRKFYYDFRNILIILSQKFYFKKIILRLIRICLGRGYFAIKNNLLSTYFRVIFDLLLNLHLIVKGRQVLKADTQERFRYGEFAGGFFFYNKNYGNTRYSMRKNA